MIPRKSCPGHRNKRLSIKRKTFQSKSFFSDQNSFFPIRILFSQSKSFSNQIGPDPFKKNFTFPTFQILFFQSNLFHSNQLPFGPGKEKDYSQTLCTGRFSKRFLLLSIKIPKIKKKLFWKNFLLSTWPQSRKDLFWVPGESTRPRDF